MSYQGSGASSRAQKIEWLRLRPGLWDGKVFGDDLQFLIKCALVDAGLYSRKTVTVDMHIADLLASATDRDRPYLVGDRVLSRAREDVVGGHGLKATGRLKFSRPRAGPPRGGNYWAYPYRIEAGTRVAARRSSADLAPIIAIVTQSGVIPPGPGPAHVLLWAEVAEHGPEGNIAPHSATLITHPPNLVIDQEHNDLRVTNDEPFTGGELGPPGYLTRDELRDAVEVISHQRQGMSAVQAMAALPPVPASDPVPPVPASDPVPPVPASEPVGPGELALQLEDGRVVVLDRDRDLPVLRQWVTDNLIAYGPNGEPVALDSPLSQEYQAPPPWSLFLPVAGHLPLRPEDCRRLGSIMLGPLRGEREGNPLSVAEASRHLRRLAAMSGVPDLAEVWGD